MCENQPRHQEGRHSRLGGSCALWLCSETCLHHFSLSTKYQVSEMQYSLSPELTLTPTWKGFLPSQTEPCAALIHHLQRLHTRKTSRLDAGTVFPGCLRQGLLTEAGLYLVPLGEPTLIANSPKMSLILKL